MKRNQIRTLIGGLSFTTALFVFQACYGMPQDLTDDVYISGTVVSRNSGLPVQGIQVGVDLLDHHALSDSLGKFELYIPLMDSVKLSIKDKDPDSNGEYLSKDTVLMKPRKEVFLNIVLDEK